MRRAVAGTGHAVEARKEPLDFLRLAIGTGKPAFRGRSKYKFFKFTFALLTSILKYRHSYL